MLTTLLRLAAGLLIAYVLITVLAWRYQEKLAFPAPRRFLPAPQAAGFPQGERVTVTTVDSVTLHGWYLPPADTVPHPAPGMLWFYGNMETVAGLAPIIRDLKPAAYGMLILDYRGYGESGGSPTEDGLYRDAEAAWTWLINRPEIDAGRIVLYGRSLGSAVALYTAVHHPVRAVALDSPFASARAMAREHYWFLPRFLVRLSLDNVARAARLDVPLLVMHGSDDRIAPVHMGRAVARAGRAQRFIEIAGSGHNETYLTAGPSYRETLHTFFEDALR